MTGPPLESAADLKRRLEAERVGVPFLYLRDGRREQQIVGLDPERDVLTVGRDRDCELCLEWDRGVSRVHARLERTGAVWTVYDDGLSTNGTFLNAERIHGHRVLNDRDQLRFGSTDVSFRDPSRSRSRTTVLGAAATVEVSPAQRRVLVVLCRPYRDASAFARPATNRQIADELVVSVDAVKSHLRALFAKFGVDDLPQNEKRARLVEQALLSGVVRHGEF